VAVTSPRQVRRVVLASTNAGMLSVPGGWRALRTLMSPARYRSSKDLRDALAAFGLDGNSSDAVRVHNEARLARPPSTRGYYGQILALTGWTSLPWLPLLRQPTLVLSGSADPAVPLVNARILAALIPHAELAVLPDGGHLVLFEQLEASVDVVARFLTRSG
jgi:poly(3-hydroxyoctanoate) depolymerase